jgi:hypothetical protein
VTLAAWLFTILVAIELALLGAAIRSRPGPARIARLLIFLVPLGLMVALRTAHAFSTNAVLDWDETYYTSLAVTGATGDGLYPYIFGFGPTHLMGGVGYAAYSYALAVKLFGPTIFGLRAVSLVVSLLGLAGIWFLVRMWYGSGTAWMAAALTAPLQLFVLSNTARMDSWTFAYVTWALVIVAVAFEHWDVKRWHLLAGLAFGLGLQVHIDTVITGIACGVLYLWRCIRDLRSTGRFLPSAQPMAAYVVGAGIGLLAYLVLNILPDTASYYITTVLVRVDATASYSTGTASIIGSFLNPQILIAKEALRYRQVFAITPALEIGLFAAGVAAMAARRTAADRLVLTLTPSVLLAAAIVLNNASPLYFIHVLPALILPMAPLFTHGVSGGSKVSLSAVTPRSLLAFVLIVSALCAVSAARTLRAIGAADMLAPPETVQRVRTLVDRRCRVAGDGALYVPFFADYPYFLSLRDTEVRHGMLYYGLTDEASYWQIKQPDAVFAPRPLRAGLSEYVTRNNFNEVEPAVWIRSGGCALSR